MFFRHNIHINNKSKRREKLIESDMSLFIVKFEVANFNWQINIGMPCTGNEWEME